MNARRLALPILTLILAAAIASGAEVKPKYGPAGHPRATPLALSNAYFREPGHAAPDFWALIGYYVPQQNGASCSAASVSMIINAARARLTKTADDRVLSQDILLDRVDVEHWKARLSLPGYLGHHGVTLDQLGNIVEATFKKFGFPNFEMRVIHVNDTSAATKKALHQALLENEKSDRDFILANFDQKVFTDDAEAGHIAPVGAYDAAHRRVLILDPDREYYEPYWVSERTFLEGMATRDPGAAKNRGYVWIRLSRAAK